MERYFEKVKEQRQIISYSLIVGIVLMLAKFGAYLLTGSNAILTDAMESIVNVVASSFAFYSIYLSSRPKDENHPYGHGKVEFFSVFLEGGLIFIAGMLILGKAIHNIFYPEEVQHLLEGIAIIACTGLVNFLLGTYMIKRSKVLKSITIHADGKHLQIDAYSTGGLLLGLFLLYVTGFQPIDTILSLGLGSYILYSGYKLLRKSIGGLMDESDFGLINQVVHVLNKKRNDAWIDVHNLRAQRYGHDLHIDCHVTLPNYYDLNRVHEEISNIGKLVNQEVNVHTELFIHADPCVPECCHYCSVKNCPIRSSERITHIEWTPEIVTKNVKHFESIG